MANYVTYTFEVRDQGTPATGLTPAFSALRRLDGAYTASPTFTNVMASAPSCTEVANGFYYFVIDWDAVAWAGHEPVLFQIDAGAGIADPAERYLTGTIDYPNDRDIHQFLFGRWAIGTNSFNVYRATDDSLLASFALTPSDATEYTGREPA